MGLQGNEKAIDSLGKAIVDDPLVLISLDFILALVSLLVDLVLFCSNEGILVDVGVDFDI